MNLPTSSVCFFASRTSLNIRRRSQLHAESSAPLTRYRLRFHFNVFIMLQNCTKQKKNPNRNINLEKEKCDPKGINRTRVGWSRWMCMGAGWIFPSGVGELFAGFAFETILQWNLHDSMTKVCESWNWRCSLCDFDGTWMVLRQNKAIYHLRKSEPPLCKNYERMKIYRKILNGPSLCTNHFVLYIHTALPSIDLWS